MRKLALIYGYDGTLDREKTLDEVAVADDLGVEAIFVAETFGIDAFVVMTQVAEHTKRTKIGSFIVSVFARSAASTAQGFISLDIASGGRAIAGIGVGTPQMAAGWHGVPFEKPLERLRDYATIMRQVFDGQPLDHQGGVVTVEPLGIAVRERPVQARLPIGIGAIIPASIRLTAELGDYWYAQAIPISMLPAAVTDFRDLVAATGRDRDSVRIKSPGLTIATTGDVEETRFARARYNAYAFRHLKALQRRLELTGHGELVPRIESAWQEGGSRKAGALVLDALGDELDFVGTPEACAERLDQQAAAGVDLHAVRVDAPDPATYAKVLATLVGWRTSPI